MPTNPKNTWRARVKRTITSFLPIDKSRAGKCLNCSACCKLPNVCPFLKIRPNGSSYCRIYIFRPLNCRKYPRTKSEHITSEICGFKFK